VCEHVFAMTASGAQLTLDGGDRLHDRLVQAGRPLSVADAATCLFALRSAPAALMRRSNGSATGSAIITAPTTSPMMPLRRTGA